MTVVIILGILAALLLGIVGFGYMVYTFISSKNSMNQDIKTKATDVFAYIGIAISLVVTVTNVLQIIFAAIDRKFPDVLNNNYYVDAYNGDVRLAISMLVVMYPIYLALSWYVAKDISKFLYKRDLFIRKAMIYLTLFVTVCTLVGTLVSTIYTYLGGEISIRFAYKALTVFVVSLALFGYYLYSMRRDYSKKSSIPTILSVVVSVLVIGAIVWSVSIIGTPSEMRAKRIDSTRLSDISRIQQEVFNSFQNTEKLPNNLEQLDNAFQGYKVPSDPVTGNAYVYKVLQQPVVKMNYTQNKKEIVTDAVFEICSDFDTVREIDSRGSDLSSKDMYSASTYYYEGDQSPFWNHKAEYTCFKRVISNDMYYGK